MKQMKESRVHKTIINTLSSFGVKIILLLTSFIIKTVFIRTLGQQYTGISGLFTDVLTILSFAELGFGTALTYSLYKPISTNDTRKISALMDFFKIVYRVVALVMLAGGLAILPFIGTIVSKVPDVKENLQLIYLLYLISAVSSYLKIHRSALLIASQKQYIISAVEAGMAIVKTIVECFVLLLFRDYTLFLILQTIFQIAQNIIISDQANKIFRLDNKVETEDKLSKEERRSLYGDVKSLAIYKVSNVVLNSSDSIIISTLLGTNVVGMMVPYTFIKKNVYNLIKQFYESAKPSIGNLSVSSNAEGQYLVFRRMNFIAFWLACFCTTSLYVLLSPFIKLWLGGNYVFSQWVVFALVADFYLQVMLNPVSSFRTSNGLFIQGKYRPLAMVIINIVVSILLAIEFGVFGVLIGTVISRVTTQAWFDPWLIYRRVFKVPFRKYTSLFGLHTLITILSAALTVGFGEIIHVSNPYLSFGIKALLCLIVPNMLVIVFWKRSEEYKYAITLLRKLIATGRKKVMKNRTPNSI